MSDRRIGYRDRSKLPLLGANVPEGSLLLDTNVIINALSARGPQILRGLLADLREAYVSVPTIAELNWTRGRLDPDRPESAAVVARLDAITDLLEPSHVLTPTVDQWRAAGALAGRAATAIAGPTRSLTATERAELVSDALTAVVAQASGVTIVTADADFDLFQQLEPRLKVLFYG